MVFYLNNSLYKLYYYFIHPEIDYLGYPFCRGRLFETLEKDNGQYEDSREIFWASGACLFVNRKAFLMQVNWMKPSLPIWKK